VNRALKITFAMDYDKSDIASIYDEARAMTPEELGQWLDLLSTHLDRNTISLIIDLGCGTGRFSEPLAARFGVRVIATDSSQTMLDQARRKPASGSVVLLRASAQALPFADSCADVVFMSMVYHHFADPVVVVKECRRVLSHSGHVCIRNSTREADFPHRHFFLAMRPLIELELPTRNDILCVFTAAGFKPVVHQIVRQVVAPNWPTFVHKSSMRADSFLARLSNEDFSSGMARLHDYGHAANRDDAVTEEIDWFVFTKHV
jgi:ubiquinone/menaquinone biosynthesis C-methylase UbiE